MLDENLTLTIAVFVLVTGGVSIIGILLLGRDNQRSQRIAQLSQQHAARAPVQPSRANVVMSKVGTTILPEGAERRNQLQERLIQAGMYRPQAASIFLGVKLILMVLPMFLGVALSLVGVVSLTVGALIGAGVGLAGTLLPSIWLRRIKASRQTQLRRGLPDALDVMVICLEGGLSLQGALARVSTELRAAHALLARELNIVQREMHLGATTGDALKRLADRFDLQELRGMASVIGQSERFGASIVNALRVHADDARVKRHQHAEAQAHKAPLKIIFPTVFCIFPALYIVLMGPALVQVFAMLENF
ncbi:MAG: type II secretion system F family protein [Thermomicrobiales bacterium]